MKTWFYPLLLLVLLLGCSPGSVEEFRSEGRATSRRMLRCLQQIDSREAAAQRSEELEKLYLEIADLIIETDPFLARQPSLTRFDPDPIGESLEQELRRVYQIPGVQPILEEAQEEALHRLSQRVALSH